MPLPDKQFNALLALRSAEEKFLIDMGWVASDATLQQLDLSPTGDVAEYLNVMFAKKNFTRSHALRLTRQYLEYRLGS